MKTLEFISILGVIFLTTSTICVNSLPAVQEEVTTESEIKPEVVLDNKDENVTSTTVSLPELSKNDTSNSNAELETAASEQNEQTIVNPAVSMEKPDNAVAESHIDPTIYGGGLLPPEAFQQYINHYGAPYPYAAAPYPAPVYPGFVPPPPPPIYPSPYVIETGYEGYLYPTTTTSTTTAATDTSSTTAATTALMNPFMLLSNFFSNLFMSPLFRILATIISTVGMIFFGNAIMDLICNITPICDISNKAVTYLRRQESAENMGRMIVEGMTSERVRRAAEFVRNAIRKYEQLQKLMGEKNYDNSLTTKRNK